MVLCWNLIKFYVSLPSSCNFLFFISFHNIYMLKRVICRIVGRSQALKGQNPLRAFINFTKWKLRRTVGSAVNPPSGVWCKTPGTSLFLDPKSLKIDRIISRKIKYCKDFFKQNCSSSTFVSASPNLMEIHSSAQFCWKNHHQW